MKAPPKLDAAELKLFEGWLATYRQKKADVNLHGDGQFINGLIDSESPYLLQHAFNPINWKVWSNKNLKTAQTKNKLILLSIGYSTCHWCHVMNKQSFSSLEVAELLNENFVAIKVDRELAPQVDDYYMMALQQVKGEAGWPITAIIDGNGLPIFIDSYLTEEKLLGMLKRVNQIWQQQPDFLIQSAKNIDKLVKQNYDVTKTARTELDYKEINKRLKKNLDSSYGGYVGEQKFPAESMLSYSLDQLSRHDDKDLERLVKLQLERMSKSGIRDHLFGGFHRYSTTSDWMIPHYEKMLYNQAQLSQIYTQAYLVFRDQQYLDIAVDTADAMIDTFLNSDVNSEMMSGFITALDADFKGEEGGYYLWNKTELEQLAIDIEPEYLYRVNSDRLGLLLRNIPDKNFVGGAIELNDWLTKLQNYKFSSGSLYFDKKVLTGWNGLAIQALVDLFQVSENKQYYKVAEEIAEVLWKERFERHLGRLKRVKSDNQNQPVFLEDYAFLSSAFVALFDVGGNKIWLQRARELNQAANQIFVEPSGLIKSTSGKTLLPSVGKLSDGEVFPAAAVFIETNMMIAKRDGEVQPAKKMTRKIDYLKSAVAKMPQGHLFSARTLSQIHQSMRSIRFAARGKAKVKFDCVELGEGICQTMSIQVDLEEGWHLNSNNPLQSHLIATQVTVPKNWQVSYPKAIEKSLSFQPEKLSLFEGSFKITLRRTVTDNQRRFLKLPVQVCSDSVCLLPETLDFYM